MNDDHRGEKGSSGMRVLAINGSPKMDRGNTALILVPFLDGMREGGAKVALLHTKLLQISPCQGEFSCMFKTPGTCFQRDDMELVLTEMRESDVWVFASPVYVDGVTGPMKNLMDRLCPLGKPGFQLRDGHSRHPLREGTRRGKVVLVSNCGLWEMDNFDPLLVHMTAFCKNVDREFAGALLRPHGGGLRAMMEMGMPVGDIFEAAKEAGRQLAEEGKMSPDALNTVSRELISLETYVRRANQATRRMADAPEKT